MEFSFSLVSSNSSGFTAEVVLIFVMESIFNFLEYFLGIDTVEFDGQECFGGVCCLHLQDRIVSYA
jgi:hypothetical protein